MVDCMYTLFVMLFVSRYLVILLRTYIQDIRFIQSRATLSSSLTRRPCRRHACHEAVAKSELC